MVSVIDERNIRFSLGAVGANVGLITEEEMDAALEMYPDWRLATAWIADSLAVRAINQPTSFSVPDAMSISWGDRASVWRQTARTLRQEVVLEQASAGPVGLQVTQLMRQPIAEDDQEYTSPRWKGMNR